MAWSGRPGKVAAERRGHLAERWAAAYLMFKGYRILERRFRTRLGEIDLVARRGGVVVFVEVKRRDDEGAGLAAITALSRNRIARAAELYLKRRPRLAALALRFDAIVITPWRWPRHIADAWRQAGG